MGEFFKVVESEEVFGFIESLETVEGEEKIGVRNALGRVLAEDVKAREALPGFDRSTVDGYAVRAEDTFGASMSIPAMLKLVGEIRINEEYEGVLKSGEAVKIPTGGKLPQGANAVVMVEDTRENGDVVEVFKPVPKWGNVMRADEDVKAGEVVVREGERITPGTIALLLSLGVTDVKVRRKVKIGLISTGDEIIEPEEGRRYPFIRDSNTHTLGVLLDAAGYSVKRYGIARDDFNELKRFLERSLAENDVTVISGGSSVGVRDFTVEAINSLGEPGVVIHGVLISPGKPTIFGKVGRHVFVGLPGNPSSFMLSAFYFLFPLLRRMSGRRDWQNEPTGIFKVTTPVYSKQGRETLIWATRKGKYVEPVFFKSGMVKPMKRAEGFIRIPPGVEGFEEGEEVEFYGILEVTLG